MSQPYISTPPLSSRSDMSHSSYSNYAPQRPLDNMYRQQAFAQHQSYPSPRHRSANASQLPSIRLTGLLDSPVSKNASPPLPRQMPTPPGSGDFGPMIHKFSHEPDEGYDSETGYPSLFPPPQSQYRQPPVANPQMPSLEELIKYHINIRDDRDFRARQISPPSFNDYKTMSHFWQETEQLRRQSSEYADAYGPSKRKTGSDYAPSYTAATREDSNSTVDDFDSDYTPVQASKKRRSSGPSRRRGESEFGDRRGHGRTSSKSSNKGAAVAKNARAQKSKAQKSDRFEDYPDFAPPASSMTNGLQEAKSVKDWHGSSINVYEDPDREKLSEAELEVAQRLHLPCAKYLCVKRQIFEELVKWLREEQDKKTPNWNKTTAQGAVNCDVTKASELFMFFSRVGWFNRDLFRKWIEAPRGSLEYSSQTGSTTG